MTARAVDSRRVLAPRMSLPTLVVIASVIVVLAAVVLIIVYRMHFGGTLSDRQEVWAYFGDYFGGVLSVVLSFLSVAIAFYVLLKTNRDKRFERIYDLLDEFRSDQMSTKLKLLWDFYEFHDFRRRIRPIGESTREQTLTKRYLSEHKNMTDVYLARRSVSYYYLNLSLFLRNNRLDKDSTLALWPVSSISTLKTIIIPCELAISGKAGSDKLPHFQYLIELWEQFHHRTRPYQKKDL